MARAAPCPLCDALLSLLERIRVAELEVERNGGFHGKVLRAQRTASAQLDRIVIELEGMGHLITRRLAAERPN